MSRAYRITVKESLKKDLSASDEVCSDLEILEILPSDQMAELMRGELKDFGNCLNEAWNLKIQMSPNVSNQKINEIYAAALSAGALGGKLLGAGDGGFFLVFVETLHRRSVTEALQKLGIEMKSVRFEQKGAYSWRTRTT